MHQNKENNISEIYWTFIGCIWTLEGIYICIGQSHVFLFLYYLSTYMDHPEEEGIIFRHLLDIYKVHMDVWEHICMHCAVAISYSFCYLLMIPITHRHYDNFYIIHRSIHPLEHHQTIKYDLSLLFLSFSFIFHVICEDSSSYTCINQGHLVP